MCLCLAGSVERIRLKILEKRKKEREWERCTWHHAGRNVCYTEQTLEPLVSSYIVTSNHSGWQKQLAQKYTVFYLLFSVFNGLAASVCSCPNGQCCHGNGKMQHSAEVMICLFSSTYGGNIIPHLTHMHRFIRCISSSTLCTQYPATVLQVTFHMFWIYSVCYDPTVVMWVCVCG